MKNKKKAKSKNFKITHTHGKVRQCRLYTRKKKNQDWLIYFDCHCFVCCFFFSFFRKCIKIFTVYGILINVAPLSLIECFFFYYFFFPCFVLLFCKKLKIDEIPLYWYTFILFSLIVEHCFVQTSPNDVRIFRL